MCDLKNCGEPPLDFITQEELTKESKFIHRNGMCVGCDIIKEMRGKNPLFFNKNPGQFIFGLNLDKKETKKLWVELNKICDVKYVVEKEEKITFIAPNIFQAKTNYKMLKARNPRLKNLLKGMMEIISTSDDVVRRLLTEHDQRYVENDLREEYLAILQKSGWTCMLVHNPLELPFVFGVIFQILVDKDRLDIFEKFAFESMKRALKHVSNRFWKKLASNKC